MWLSLAVLCWRKILDGDLPHKQPSLPQVYWQGSYTDIRVQILTCEVSLRWVLIHMWILCFTLEGHLQLSPYGLALTGGIA